MAPLTREQQMALKKKQAEDRPPAQDDPLDAIKQHLQGGGKILPIVGNSLVDNLIFPLSAEEGKIPRVDEFLAEFWAEKVGYPFVQRTRMAHIAQFVLMRGAAPSIAKKSYVDFLKELRLDMSETMDEEVEFLAGLRRKSGSLAFTDICAELDLTSTADKNPLDALAEMNLPLYITTSYYDFLERALQQAGKNPLTHICFWDGPPPPEAGEHAAERDFRLGDPKTPGFRPIVYHLLGHERFPETMVLAEDDFLKYLKKIAVDSPNSQRPVIPTYLRDQIANSALVMMGLNIADWDFRMLFHGVLPLAIENKPRHPCLALQLDPSKQRELVEGAEGEEGDRESRKQAVIKAAYDYLDQYFKHANFKVVLQESGAFVQDLWRVWQEVQRESV